MYDLKLETLVFFRNSDQNISENFPIKGLVPYYEGQIIEKKSSGSGNNPNKLYKVKKIDDVFFSDSNSVLCRRIINLDEINN